MFTICKKEFVHFFSNLTGYIAVISFLVVNGLVLFVFDNNIFDNGYASLDLFFKFSPWILLLLIPAITMRSFAEELRTGTLELLQTLPLRKRDIILGKFLGNFLVAAVAILPTIIYIFCIQSLSADVGLDMGATITSYIGIFLLAALFVAIGVCVSSFTNNTVIAFIISLISCVLFYYGFTAISQMQALQGGWDYYVALLGIDFHFNNIRKGVVDSSDVIYFLVMILFFLFLTFRNLFK